MKCSENYQNVTQRHKVSKCRQQKGRCARHRVARNFPCVKITVSVKGKNVRYDYKLIYEFQQHKVRFKNKAQNQNKGSQSLGSNCNKNNLMLKPRVSRIKWLYCLLRTELVSNTQVIQMMRLQLWLGGATTQRPEKSTSYVYLEYI